MLIFLLSLTDEQYRSQIERIYRVYHEKMLRVAFCRLAKAGRNDPDSDAQDVVQSTFFCIVRYAHTVPFDKPEAELKAYVFTILRHEIDKMLTQPELPLENGVDNIADAVSLYELGERIHIREKYDEVVLAIRNMEPIYSTVLLLCYGQDMTAEQAAKVLHIPTSTVYTRLRRAKQQLIEQFEKEEL